MSNQWSIAARLRPAIILVLGLTLTAYAADAGTNLLTNEGFEEWTDYKPQPRVLATFEDNLAPAWWSCTIAGFGSPTDPITGKFARDMNIKHGGASSIRLQSDGLTDQVRILTRAVDALPNSTYKVTLWYRGEGIEIDPANVKRAGVIFAISQGPTAKFWDIKTSIDVKPQVADGTFDWRKVEIRFDTQPTTEKLLVQMLLRFARGKLWLDDVKLELEQ